MSPGRPLTFLMLASGLLQGEEAAAAPWYRPVTVFAHDTAQDASRTVTAPLRWDGSDWAIAGVGAGIVLGAGLLFDHRLHIDSQEDRTPNTDAISRYSSNLGTGYSLAVLGVAAIDGWAFGHPRSSHLARDGMEATLITSCLVVPVLKLAVGRSRPNSDENGADDYTPFGGGYSFPSGPSRRWRRRPAATGGGWGRGPMPWPRWWAIRASTTISTSSPMCSPAPPSAAPSAGRWWAGTTSGAGWR
jgi:hypothetical protein